MNKIDDKVIDEALGLYGMGKSGREIGGILGVSHQTIYNWLRERNKEVRPNFVRKHFVNDSVFTNIQTEEQAYWLGFLAVGEHTFRDNQIRLRLSAKDEGHIKKFRDFITQGAEYETSDDAHSVNIVSDGITRDLSIHRATSGIIGVPEELLRHYYRGSFDRRGSIRVNKRVDMTMFTLLGNKEFLNKFRVYIEKHTGVYIVPAKRLGNKRASYIQKGGNPSVGRLLRWLYLDATIYLDRKYNLAMSRMFLGGECQEMNWYR